MFNDENSNPDQNTNNKLNDKVSEPPFRPPESYSKDEETIDMSIEDQSVSDPKGFSVPKTKKKLNPLTWFKGLSKKQKILFVLVIILSIAAASGGAYALLKKPAPKPAPVVQKKEEPVKEVPLYSNLTGVQVTKEQSELPVTGVMIENSPDARPQAGLNQAGVVFEAIAEGGITRFLTLWQETRPDYVGPVRSARPYYVDWLQGFDAGYAHVGGSAEALQQIKNDGVKDLDQFQNPAPYKRVSNRYAPHNMYTNLNALLDVQKSKGWGTSKFDGFPRKDEKASAQPTARSIDMTISGPLYNVHYDYDQASNSYKRAEGGKPHLDERSKEQISPKVVIAIVVPYSIMRDGLHSSYQTIGSGKTIVFQDGEATEGTWEKSSAKAQISFKDSAGNAIKLNRGQTWITAVSIPNNIIYKP